MNWSLLNYIIPAIVMLVTAVIVVRKYMQKLPKVAALDLEASAKHRQAQRKASIVEERLARRMAANRERIKKVFRPIGKGITWLLRSFFARIKQLEDTYRAAAKGVAGGEVSAVSLDALLEQAQTLFNDNKYPEAEKAYIKAVAADSTSVEAYRGLSKVYAAQKDRVHALETLRFLQQLEPNDESVWREMGDLYTQEGSLEEALESYEKATELVPNNPKNLDALIRSAIANTMKYRAQSALDTLREVNPENNSIEEYQKQIDAL